MSAVDAKALVEGLATMVSDQLAHPGDPVVLAKDLLDLLLSSGIAPALLADYLTPAGIAAAERSADISEEAKLAVEGKS